MSKLRLLFEKRGRAIYISHLDLMRTMQRSFSRAGFSLKYSEGFNPHPQISILMPLSVGTSSECEMMDFQILEDADSGDIVDRLNHSFPEGIEAKEVFEPQMKAGELKWLRVQGRFEYDNGDIPAYTAALTEFFSKDEIIVNKRTKRGTADINLIDGIKELSFRAGEFVQVEAVVSAVEPTINPELIAEALRQNCPELAPDFVAFHRTGIYDKDMNQFR